MIPLGILASSVRRASAALLAPTDLVATLIAPTPTLPTVIGEPYGGGFYAGDIQYPDGQWYKLIVADKSADITGSDSRWKTTDTSTAGTDHLTDGVANTSAMIAAGIELHPAAAHCIDHRGGGNADWYMPAKDELNVIYQNLGYNRPNCPPDFQSGGPHAFSNAWYWASTQYSSSSAWMQHFSDGTQGSYYGLKLNAIQRVRPVRHVPFTPDLPTVIGEIFGGGTYIGDITVADGGANDGTYAVIMAGEAAGASRSWKSTEIQSPVANSVNDGMANSLAVVNLDPMDYFAARHCLDYRGGGYADWYLPAQNELDLVWRNRLALVNADIASMLTWTSTLYGSGNVAFKNPYQETFTYNTPRTPRWTIPVRRIKRS